MNEQSYEYRTGQTAPEKSHRGLIAFLLICIIFLCGMVSMLSMMNIRLFRELEQASATSPLSFEAGDPAPLMAESEGITLAGITLQETPALYGQLNELPAGLYVVDAPENSPVLPGDILTAFDGTALSSLSDLKNLQSACREGQQIDLAFHRQDAEPFTHTITFGE